MAMAVELRIDRNIDNTLCETMLDQEFVGGVHLTMNRLIPEVNHRINPGRVSVGNEDWVNAPAVGVNSNRADVACEAGIRVKDAHRLVQVSVEHEAPHRPPSQAIAEPRRYGVHGADYIECHHRIPLHVTGETQTRLADLALLCSNCHRMIHRTKQWLKVEDLKELVEQQTRLTSTVA
jgi:hypothetical protein